MWLSSTSTPTWLLTITKLFSDASGLVQLAPSPPSARLKSSAANRGVGVGVNVAVAVGVAVAVAVGVNVAVAVAVGVGVGVNVAVAVGVGVNVAVGVGVGEDVFTVMTFELGLSPAPLRARTR